MVIASGGGQHPLFGTRFHLSLSAVRWPTTETTAKKKEEGIIIWRDKSKSGHLFSGVGPKKNPTTSDSNHCNNKRLHTQTHRANGWSIVVITRLDFFISLRKTKNLEKNFRIEFVWQIFLEKPWTCYRVAPTFHSWAPSRFRMPFCWNAASALWRWSWSLHCWVRQCCCCCCPAPLRRWMNKKSPGWPTYRIQDHQHIRAFNR